MADHRPLGAPFGRQQHPSTTATIAAPPVAGWMSRSTMSVGAVGAATMRQAWDAAVIKAIVKNWQHPDSFCALVAQLQTQPRTTRTGATIAALQMPTTIWQVTRSVAAAQSSVAVSSSTTIAARNAAMPISTVRPIADSSPPPPPAAAVPGL